MENNNIILSQIPLEKLREIVRDCVTEAISKSHPTSTSSDDELIKVYEAIKLLGISKVTLHKWRKAGIIPFYRISSRIYFKKSELIETLNASPKYRRRNTM